ncbi:hypothetical protein PR202_gb01831 [Eleusine coracana subsp. coracana]|uniref:KIB1-4 beta-propeller domain-containing protein n=1 Tax=Eleusine coracana subsp. coracana TaxID=191504 RepID=A0AAV5DXR5_ELECO|nr:hypothetical protein PR202_gb01831 [Eleusine coracana subsp. coracana]
MDPVRLAFDDQLIDILYTDSGKVYSLTKCGDVHLLRLPEHCRREPASADEAGPSEPEFSVLQPHSPQAISYQDLYMAGFQGPHMNAPATVEPLLGEAKIRFTPATVFAPPYGTVSALTLVKNLVFCKGNLYQVWRNASCNVSYQLVKSGQCRILENEIIVLRYYPQRQPCWDVVKDLGDYSFFVGRNNAVSIYAEGVPGLKGNCVYWIGGRGRDQGMIFDLATRQTAPCQPPQIERVLRYSQRTICWYFLSDIVSSGSGGGRRVEQTSVGARSDVMQDLQE